MNLQSTTSGPENGESMAHDLFALTDEQILEIEPEPQDTEMSSGSRAGTGDASVTPGLPAQAGFSSGVRSPVDSTGVRKPDPASGGDKTAGEGAPINRGATQASGSAAEHEPRNAGHTTAPPAWLAEAMNDPQRGAPAREFWNGVQQAQQETAAYRAVFAKPEEASAAADRARLLDNIDRAYFAGDAQQRSELAAMMLREDPAAFREMVFMGLRALEETGKQGSRELNTPGSPSIAAGQRDSSTAGRDAGGPSLNTGGPEGEHLAAYAAFERAANQELERSVGGAISRTIEQALPNLSKADRASGVGAHHSAPLQARLQSAIRQEVEKALQADRQLSQQVAQILGTRNLNDESRAQVVRLIGERANQLVPGAAKRVLQEWTQTTLAAHRGKTERSNAASSRREVPPASSPAAPSTDPRRKDSSDLHRSATQSGQRRVDYRKLSDEQILNM